MSAAPPTPQSATAAALAQTFDRAARATAAASARQGDVALDTLLETIAANDADFDGTVGGAIRVGAVRRMSELRGVLLHRHSMERYGAETVDAVQRRLVISLTKNVSLRSMVDDVAGVNGIVDKGRPRLS